MQSEKPEFAKYEANSKQAQQLDYDISSDIRGLREWI